MSGSWRWVTDGGLETDLIFHRGVELRELAAYPLVRSPDGRDLLRAYYEGYAEIAETVGAGLRLEAPTWRANPDWAARLGDGSAALDAVNRAAVEQLRELASEWSGRVEDTTVAGIVGPRGDGYARGEAATAEEAAEYHAPRRSGSPGPQSPPEFPRSSPSRSSRTDAWLTARRSRRP